MINWGEFTNYIYTDLGSQNGVLFYGKPLFDEQISKFTSYLLLKDSDCVEVYSLNATMSTDNLYWPNKGELISGSFVAASIKKLIHSDTFPVNDIDIYFKSKEDAVEFTHINNMSAIHTAHCMCISIMHNSCKLNLIWGVEYSSPKNLISRFDIRACSVAYDPNYKQLYIVKGAIHDIYRRMIIFNPTPRTVTICRLAKYLSKGFVCEKYQRLFFSELVRSDLYNPELELTTGY
jgi:hypothetical protein